MCRAYPEREREMKIYMCIHICSNTPTHINPRCMHTQIHCVAAMCIMAWNCRYASTYICMWMCICMYISDYLKTKWKYTAHITKQCHFLALFQGSVGDRGDGASTESSIHISVLVQLPMHSTNNIRELFCLIPGDTHVAGGAMAMLGAIEIPCLIGDIPTVEKLSILQGMSSTLHVHLLCACVQHTLCACTIFTGTLLDLY